MDFHYFGANFIANKVQHMKIKDANLKTIKEDHPLLVIRTFLNVYTRLIRKIVKWLTIEYTQLFNDNTIVNQRLGRFYSIPPLSVLKI